MENRMTARIVVGVDGSEESVSALRWALAEAERRGAILDVVHAWHYPYVACTEITGMAAAALDMDDLESAGRAVLDHSLERAAAAHSGVRVEPILVQGGAAATLVDAAVGADLLVVGTRGRGGFAGLVLGSVSQHCSTHAPCPVVIVPQPDRDSKGVARSVHVH
jgi:nucleotide-binding universal stress UspA family protein